MDDATECVHRLEQLGLRLRERVTPQRVLGLLLGVEGGESLIPYVADGCIVLAEGGSELEIGAPIGGAEAALAAVARLRGPQNARAEDAAHPDESSVPKQAVDSVLADGTALWLMHRPGSHSRYAPEGNDESLVASAVVLPLSASERSLGALVLGFDGPRELCALERRCVGALAALCAQAVDRARLHEALAASLEGQSRLRKDVEMEVRNHQNAVEGYLAILELAHGDAVTDAQIAYLRNIRRSGAELLESVNSLLYGDIPDLPALRLEDVEVHELVAGAQRYLLPDLRAKRLGFEYRPSSLMLTVRADRAQVTQILLRLLANAIRYTQRGTIVVSFAEHDDTVLIQVRDNGAGIPAGTLRSVFTWSQNVPRPHGERRLPGLNLARARTIAQKLGGELTASSEEGRGTTFTLTLPKGQPGVQLGEG